VCDASSTQEGVLQLLQACGQQRAANASRYSTQIACITIAHLLCAQTCVCDTRYPSALNSHASNACYICQTDSRAVALSNAVVTLNVCLIKLCVCTTGILKAPAHRPDNHAQATHAASRQTHSLRRLQVASTGLLEQRRVHLLL